MNDGRWQDVPKKFLEAWYATFQSSKEILDLSAPCPVCSNQSLHRYYYLHNLREYIEDGKKYIGRGGLWEWCSKCGSYQHYSAFVPDWWECDMEVDLNELTHAPTALE